MTIERGIDISIIADKIKENCPFCGISPLETLTNPDPPYNKIRAIVTVECGAGTDAGFHVLCEHCGAMGPHGEDRAEAIGYWNRRGRL